MSAEPRLIDFLKSDLERYYHYYGRPGRTPRAFEVCKNFLIPRCAPVALYRLSHAAHVEGFTALAKLITWINFYLHGVEIASSCAIGTHFFMPHAAGSVIGAISIGNYAVIYHQVTIGAKSIEHSHVGRPSIGNHVVIASGAKVIGDLHIGDGCVIGANAVVTKSAAPNQVLTGIPATARSKRETT